MLPRYFSLQPFVPWQQSERPAGWSRLFGRAAELEVEIGFGSGEFLVQLARAQPDRNFVGLELEWAVIQKALRKIALARAPNVRVLLVDARVALERLFAPQSISRVYSLFPFPWPKKRHVKHRLFTSALLKLLNSRLVNGGEARIVTDDRSFSEWVAEQIPGTGFRLQRQAVPPRFGTRYERKWRREGQERFYELQLIKETALSVPVVEDIPLRIHRLARFHPDRFHPEGTGGPLAVEFKDFIFDPVRSVAMVRVVVAEDSLLQNFWIEIVKGEGGWSIRAAKGCSMVPTAGAQKALDLVKEAAEKGLA
ncbi:MAG: tRNA (guanosine(46)-N7)-methyltransferase TrmB [Planctomycetes bacterium]|nr:tRNA (guanosine(46)-N7)-methyltransferase TrmB [Planctomycetota bacterium]